MRYNKTKYSLTFIIVFVLCALTFSGCSLTYDSVRVGNFDIGYSKIEKNAFIAHCIWEGGATDFTVPDSYGGYPITELGGYIGRGYPMPFCVEISRDVLEYDGAGMWVDEEDDCEILCFTIRFGKNIKKINLIDGKTYLVKDYFDEDGNFDHFEALYKIVYFFAVDEGNSIFYADTDGILRYKNSDKVVDEFFYAAAE